MKTYLIIKYRDSHDNAFFSVFENDKYINSYSTLEKARKNIDERMKRNAKQEKSKNLQNK